MKNKLKSRSNRDFLFLHATFPLNMHLKEQSFINPNKNV